MLGFWKRLSVLVRKDGQYSRVRKARTILHLPLIFEASGWSEKGWGDDQYIEFRVLVSDVMTAFPAYIRLGATIRRAAEMVSVSEVGHLMVLDHDGRFVGSLSEEDVVRAMLPGFADVTAAGGTLADAFRIFLERGRALADRVIDPLVVRDAATVRPADELARAAIVMIDRGIRRLPVVDDGALVGTLSRADLCRAVIYHS